MIRCYPQETCNPNVPKDVFLVSEGVYTSGELTETHYIDRTGKMFFVSDWADDCPVAAFMFQLCRLTLDTEQAINNRFDNWKRNR